MLQILKPFTLVLVYKLNSDVNFSSKQLEVEQPAYFGLGEDLVPKKPRIKHKN